MKKLTFAIIAIGILSSCGETTPTQDYRNCRENALINLEGQYDTPEQLDTLLDAVCKV